MTSVTRERIVAAAERRMRNAGYHGFSFRKIAAEVGVKSASVHHHFATKEDLAVTVIESYAARFLRALGAPNAPDAAPHQLISRFVAQFRSMLAPERRMCLCGLIAAERASLPPRVARAGAVFFEQTIAWLIAVGRRASPDIAEQELRTAALRIVAILEGAMLLSETLDDDQVFETIAASIGG
ncbi:MAG: TetR/AcrR family transcriptional regulator [Neomegalonema sp.]|nr:TetR/AcrR family transcriptional regulator [Neomegalonema sp.]